MKKFYTNKSFIFIILSVIIITGFFGFWFYRDKVFSKEILKLEILGPDLAKMAEEVEYTIKYKNNGNFVLQNPKLIFELPDNSLTEDSKKRFEQTLKDIYPGEEDFVKFKGRLLGKDGDLKVAHAWLSYTPKNLTARYESDTTFTTKIEAISLTMDFDLPARAEKGKEIQYSLNYFSNIDYPLENLSIKIEPVDGFSLQKTEPVSLDNIEWKIPTLLKTHGGRINITGTVTADTGRQLNFSAKIGMWQDGQFMVIKEKVNTVDVMQSQVFVSQLVNGTQNYVASPGEKLHYQIFFRNIGSSDFDNLFLLVKFNNLAFDVSQAKATSGEIRQLENSIAFDYKQNFQLQHLSAGAEGSIEFDIKLKDNINIQDSNKNNLLATNTALIAGVSQDFSIKVNSKLEISQKAFYSNQSGISNFGPIPPKSSEQTTYVVTWQAKNYANDVKNVKVKAVLPQGVSLTGFISPESELSRFTLDSASRQLIWSIGDVKAGQIIEPMSFQVSITPQNSEQGSVIDLIGQAIISGEDQFTSLVVSNTASGINTNLPDDSIYSNKGTVQ